MIIPVNVIDLHARGVIVRGIYQGLPEYAAHIPAAQRLAAQLMADGKLSLAVDAVYPLDNYAEAVAHSLRGGKVLLDLRTRP
jgi:NADPH:quinone reductase-like Zn-dependent oxidoreductase